MEVTQFAVVAESVYNEGQYLFLTPYRKNKRTQYRFETNPKRIATFKDKQIALNYGNRASRMLTPKVVTEDNLAGYLSANQEREDEMDIMNCLELGWDGHKEAG